MMNGSRIRFAFGVGLIFTLLSTGACRGEVTPADEADAPARDSTLATRVLLAGDSSMIVDMSNDTIDLGSGGEFEGSEPARAAPVVVAAPRPLSRATEIRKKAPAPPPRQRIAAQQVSDERPVTSTMTVPAGTRLSLEAGRRICVNTSKVGDTFTARLIGGASIPGGASAIGQVSSLVGPMGEEDLRIVVRSVAVGSRRYPVSARVTKVELDRRAGAYRCIPDDGRIIAQLTEPLRIRL